MSSKDKNITVISIYIKLDYWYFFTQRNVGIGIVIAHLFCNIFTVSTIYLVNIDLKLEFPIHVRRYFDSVRGKSKICYIYNKN